MNHHRDIVVIGASAGGVETLTEIISGIAEPLPAAIFVVLHLMPEGKSMLPEILDRVSPMPVVQAGHGDPIETGKVYVAPADRHLIVSRDVVLLNDGPRENGHRPAVDPLFRSAAHAYGSRVIGIILSGLLDDGAAGLASVKDRAGIALVQDPDDAIYPAMPRAAIAATQVDSVLAAAKIPTELAKLTSEQVVWEQAANGQPPQPVAGRLGSMTERAFTPFTCPDCGGSLWEENEGGVAQFRCHVGHVFSTESMLHEHGESVQTAMWAALRMLEERGELLRRMSRRANGRVSTRFLRRADEADAQAEGIRTVLVGLGSVRADA